MNPILLSSLYVPIKIEQIKTNLQCVINAVSKYKNKLLMISKAVIGTGNNFLRFTKLFSFFAWTPQNLFCIPFCNFYSFSLNNMLHTDIVSVNYHNQIWKMHIRIKHRWNVVHPKVQFWVHCSFYFILTRFCRLWIVNFYYILMILVWSSNIRI